MKKVIQGERTGLLFENREQGNKKLVEKQYSLVGMNQVARGK